VTVGASGDVVLSANYNFVSNQVAGTQKANAQWYKWNGSSDVAIGSPVLSSTYTAVVGEPAAGACNYTNTGNTPGSTQKYRLYGYANGSYIVYMSGACNAVSS